MRSTRGAPTYRYVPAEVEAAINEHPAVHSCAVIGLPRDGGGNDVHAIVQADEAELPAPGLLEFLAGRAAPNAGCLTAVVDGDG